MVSFSYYSGRRGSRGLKILETILMAAMFISLIYSIVLFYREIRNFRNKEFRKKCFRNGFVLLVLGLWFTYVGGRYFPSNDAKGKLDTEISKVNTTINIKQ